MYLKAVIFLILLIFKVYSINGYPLPDSFTNNIQVAPLFGVIHFSDLDISVDGGEIKSIHETVGIRINIGEPFSGLFFQYQYANGYVTSGASSSFKETLLNIDMFKVRYSKRMIDDGIGTIALFSSVGQLVGNYKITNSTEGVGITNYVVRDFNAYCADFGVTFGYEFNPDWVIFMEAAYQISVDESLQNLAGVELSDPEIDLSGAMIQIGSAFRL